MIRGNRNGSLGCSIHGGCRHESCAKAVPCETRCIETHALCTGFDTSGDISPVESLLREVSTPGSTEDRSLGEARDLEPCLDRTDWTDRSLGLIRNGDLASLAFLVRLAATKVNHKAFRYKLDVRNVEADQL